MRVRQRFLEDWAVHWKSRQRAVAVRERRHPEGVVSPPKEQLSEPLFSDPPQLPQRSCQAHLSITFRANRRDNYPEPDIYITRNASHYTQSLTALHIQRKGFNQTKYYLVVEFAQLTDEPNAVHVDPSVEDSTTKVPADGSLM